MIRGDCGSSAPLAEPRTGRTRTLPRPVSGEDRRQPASAREWDGRRFPAGPAGVAGASVRNGSKVAGLPGSEPCTPQGRMGASRRCRAPRRAARCEPALIVP